MTTENIQESNNEEIQNSSSLNESGNEEKELDLRGQIAQALNEDNKEVAQEDKSNENSENKKEPEAENKAESQKAKENSDSDSEIDLPDAWKSRSNSEDWKNLPSSIKKLITERESEVQKGFSKLDEDRNFGKQLKDVIQPYEHIISAEGGNPVAAVQSLLNTAYLLRTADPVKKAQLFSALAKQYEVNLQDVASGKHEIDPVQQLRDELEQFKKTDQERQSLAQQQEDQKIQKQIDEFAANAPHFEKLKPLMASFFNSGQANDLKTAYDLAFRAHPETSQEWIKAEIAKNSNSQQSEVKAKVESAKKAGVSVSGSSGSVSRVENLSGSLREDLEREFRKSRAV